MPTSRVSVKNYRFKFYSSDEGEPAHIHVQQGNKQAKFWLEPELRLARNVHGSFKEHELNEIYDIIEEHRSTFLEEWHEHFGG
ncbi:MAG TPA: DUF4160 domain-containing protein [Chloroflexia bacterium]|jgi:hypothetical protein